MNQLQIIYKRVEDLIPYINNPRKNDQAVDKVASSIKNFGFRVPIVLDSKNEIITGHTRLKASIKLGIEEVPCIVADDLTESQIKAFRIADNRVAEEADWDKELLALEIEGLENMNFDLQYLGFDDAELNSLINSKTEDAVDDGYEVSLPSKAYTQQGDVWLLGDHRLICGDSTHEDVYETLMNGKEADAVITDPPYNVNYEGGTGLKIQNDHFESDKGFYNFLKAFYDQTLKVIKKGAPIYVFHADSEGVNFRTAMQDSGFEIKQCLIWVKNSLVLGRQDYHWRHEPILYGWKPGNAHKWYGERDKDTVIDDYASINPKKMSKEELVAFVQKAIDDNNPRTTVIYNDKPSRNDIHPTMKPIPLIGKLMKNSSKKGDIILEPFGGSGSTIMTAEQLDRKCYTIELDEKYVDVIVNRYFHYITINNLNKKITLIRNNKEYDVRETKVLTKEEMVSAGE